MDREKARELIKELIEDTHKEKIDAVVDKKIKQVMQQITHEKKVENEFNKSDNKKKLGLIAGAIGCSKNTGSKPQDILKGWGYEKINEMLLNKPVNKEMQAGNYGEGGSFISPEVTKEYIALLRNKTAIRRLGARVMGVGFESNMPKITGGITAYYKGENQYVNAEGLTTGGLRFSPKQLIAEGYMSQHLVRLNPVLNGEFLAEDITNSAKVKEDIEFIRGSGTDFTPKGVRYLAGTVTASAGTGYENIDTDFLTALQVMEEANVDMSKLGVMISPRIKRAIRQERGTYGQPIYPNVDNGILFGMPYVSTPQIPRNLGGGGSYSEIYIVNMNDLIIGEYMDLLLKASDTATFHDSDGNTTSAWEEDWIVVKAMAWHDLKLRYDDSAYVINEVDYTA